MTNHTITWDLMKSEMNHMKTNIIVVDLDLLWYTAAEEYWGVYSIFSAGFVRLVHHKIRVNLRLIFGAKKIISILHKNSFCCNKGGNFSCLFQ